jgi:hypothetical protein
MEQQTNDTTGGTAVQEQAIDKGAEDLGEKTDDGTGTTNTPAEGDTVTGEQASDR